MQFSIPSNVIPWLLGSIILLFLGVRSWIHLSKVNTPTTRFFVVVGLLGGLGLACYSIPSILTNDPQILKLGFLLGIPLLYSMFVYQTYFTWFGILKKKISYAWLLVPALAIAVTTMIIELNSTLQDNIYIDGGKLVFQFPQTSRFLQSILLLFVLVNGLWFIKEAFSIKDLSSKLRFFAFGIIFAAISASTISDNIFSGGNNSSKFLVYAYLVSFVSFFVTLLLIIRKNAKK